MPTAVGRMTSSSAIRAALRVQISRSVLATRPITVDGAQWALVKTNAGYDGAASVFKPHEDRAKVADVKVNREQILTKQAERSIAALALERFFDSFHKAWDSGESAGADATSTAGPFQDGLRDPQARC